MGLLEPGGQYVEGDALRTGDVNPPAQEYPAAQVEMTRLDVAVPFDWTNCPGKATL